MGVSMSAEQKMKKCKFCGKSLPEEAIFCYYCHRELLTRPERPSSETQSRPLSWVIVGVIAVIVVVIVVVILLGL
jgi:predicted nucleic acid-binding Zn ribbon protein